MPYFLVDFSDFSCLLLKLLKMINLVIEEIFYDWCICSLKFIESIEDLIEVFLENFSFWHELGQHLKAHFAISLLPCAALDQFFDLCLWITSFLERVWYITIRDRVGNLSFLGQLEIRVGNRNSLHLLLCVVLCGLRVQIWTLELAGRWLETMWR